MVLTKIAAQRHDSDSAIQERAYGYAPYYMHETYQTLYTPTLLTAAIRLSTFGLNHA